MDEKRYVDCIENNVEGDLSSRHFIHGKAKHFPKKYKMWEVYLIHPQKIVTKLANVWDKSSPTDWPPQRQLSPDSTWHNISKGWLIADYYRDYLNSTAPSALNQSHHKLRGFRTEELLEVVCSPSKPKRQAYIQSTCCIPLRIIYIF